MESLKDKEMIKFEVEIKVTRQGIIAHGINRIYGKFYPMPTVKKYIRMALKDIDEEGLNYSFKVKKITEIK